MVKKKEKNSFKRNSVGKTKKRQIKKLKNKKLVLKKTSPKKLRQDFEIFAKGVQRLEELRAELNNLNTIGYEDEVACIKSKLKNVSYIPEIEREIRNLKEKIEGKSLKSKIKEKSSDSNEKIYKRIRELEKEIEKRAKFKGKNKLSKKQVKLIQEIPKIEEQLVYLRRVIIQHNEQEKRKKEILKNIDPGVNLLINDKFNLTLDEIKAELSRRIRSKETLIKKQLQDDLETRKKEFALKYKDLEDKFTEKYQYKIENSLRDEINKRFNNVLQEKIKELKKKFEAKTKAGLKLKKKKLEKKQIKELRKKLIKEFEKNKNFLKKKAENSVLKAKKKFKEHYEELILSHRIQLQNKMHEHLTEETKRIHKIYDEKKEREKNEFNKLKQRIAKEKNLLSKLKNNLNFKLRKVRKDEIKYKNEVREKLEKEKQDSIKKAIAEKSAVLRKRMREEFNNRLKLEIKSKEAEFEKKKADLTLEIQKKAKQLFS